MARLDVHVVDPLRDDNQRADLADQLAVRLRESGMEVVDPPQVAAEPGARDGMLIVAGVLFVQAAIESGALEWLVDKIREWLGDVEGADVEVRLGQDKIVVTNASDFERDALIEHFIRETARTQ